MSSEHAPADAESGESVLPTFEPPDDTSEEIAAVRPALRNLNLEQERALRAFRDDGVETRGALLAWLLRLQYRTLGRIPDYWYYHIATRPSALAVVLTGETRGQYGARDGTQITPAEAWSYRRRLVATYLRPACRDALRELRTKAVEYNDADDELDPERMAALAMRPALDEYYKRQREALSEWLAGFESVEALDGFCHDLDYDTFGAIKEVAPRFDYELLDDPVATRALTVDEPHYEQARERIAARYLLPAFNVSVRTLAEKAGETDDTTTDATGGVDV